MHPYERQGATSFSISDFWNGGYYCAVCVGAMVVLLLHDITHEGNPLLSVIDTALLVGNVIIMRREARSLRSLAGEGR